MARIPPAQGLGETQARMARTEADVADALRIDGSQYLRLWEKMQALVSGLTATVTTLVGQLTYTRAQIDTQNAGLSAATATAATTATAAGLSGVVPAAKGGTGTANAYSQDLSALTRRSAWVADSGLVGYVPSRVATKTDIQPAPSDLSAWLGLKIHRYRYRSAVDSLGDAAPVEEGLIAEEMHSAGLRQFVYRDEEGKPAGVEYSLLSLPALRLAQAGYRLAREAHRELAKARRAAQRTQVLARQQQKLIDDLAARVAALEEGHNGTD